MPKIITQSEAEKEITKFFGDDTVFMNGDISSIGTYDVAVKYFLVVAFNISNHEALNYVIVSHAISYFPLTAVGSIFFIFSNVNLKQIKYGDNLWKFMIVYF